MRQNNALYYRQVSRNDYEAIKARFILIHFISSHQLACLLLRPFFCHRVSAQLLTDALLRHFIYQPTEQLSTTIALPNQTFKLVPSSTHCSCKGTLIIVQPHPLPTQLQYLSIPFHSSSPPSSELNLFFFFEHILYFDI